MSSPPDQVERHTPKPEMSEIESRIRGLRRMVGNTPLLAIDFAFRGQRRMLYAKAENLNMTGSIKDRMALHILGRAYERGVLRAGDHDRRGDQRQHRDLRRRRSVAPWATRSRSSCPTG